IRSLIKGYSADDYLEANDYAEIPVGHRSVTEETFRTVHDEIWRKWYQAVNQDGYWDSQDLIRELIKTGSYGDGHPVIFCDEAQDFTPIEMHFIRRLSIFSRYRLGPERIQCLPLALAGDPCQTITPTGFRWESVTSGFHTEVLEMLPWHQRPGFRLRHCALTRNYRCMAGIVRLANLILLWRHQYLGTSSLEPQRFWRRQAEVTPKVRVLSDQVSPREFSDALSNLVVVVPVEAQEIPGYVRNDPLLAPLCERLTGADAGRPGNVFSAMMVKGMEFERVVLYKFGKHIPNAMPWDRGARNEAATETDDSDIEAGYFLNRLYVALTRAKTELLVFDDEQGCDALWDRADDRSIEELLQLMDPTQRDRWRRLVGGIRRDSGWNVNQIAASDPASVAKELEERGEEANDADALASAAYFFNRAGEARRADLCRAKELRARGQYAAAGDAFLSRGDHDEALRCYWDGCCWHQLAKLTQDLPDEVRPELRRFAAFMTSTQSDFDHLTAVADEINELRERVVRRYGVPAWREIGGQLAHRAMQLADQGQPNQWVKIAVALRILADGGYRGYEEPARAYVRAGNYPEAVKLFETSGKTDEDDYFWAKAAVVGAPDGLAWLSRMASRQRAASEAFRLWEAAGGFAARDRNKWLQTGGQLLRTREEFWSALRSFVAASLSLDELEEVLNLVPDQGQVDQQVVAQWRASQGHTQDDTDRWLRHVAPRLERMGAYAEAFRAYASMPGGLRDARHCLSKAAQTWSDAEVQDAVAMLLHRAAQDEPERVASVLHACMDQYPQAAAAAHRLRCEAIRQLASSSMQRDPSLSHRETEDLVAAVTEAGGWEEHVQWFEVGAVLERCGSLARSVEFYHHWQSRLTGDQQQAARRRWLSVRMRQAQYHRSQRQTDQAETIERLFEHQASAWGIPRASIQPDYPVLVPTQDRAPTVQGLPPKTPVSVSPEGRVEFSVDGLRCLADRTSHVVMLTDESTLQVLRIDARSMQIQTIGSASPEGMVEIPGGLRCRFPGTNRMIAVRAHDERREVVIETRAENVTVSLPCG
ncbi:MAG: hypothetical protein KBI47_21770, partial [Armatimonadetes bacterium]|nr:hypothetical protein [Armatimonadota bacterium]